jgi:hypothetical protein
MVAILPPLVDTGPGKFTVAEVEAAFIFTEGLPLILKWHGKSSDKHTAKITPADYIGLLILTLLTQIATPRTISVADCRGLQPGRLPTSRRT